VLLLHQQVQDIVQNSRLDEITAKVLYGLDGRGPVEDDGGAGWMPPGLRALFVGEGGGEGGLDANVLCVWWLAALCVCVCFSGAGGRWICICTLNGMVASYEWLLTPPLTHPSPRPWQ
jgi:hypothetical protein